MGLRFHVGLPGPFVYSKRIGGRRKSQTPNRADGSSMLWAVGLIALFFAWGWIPYFSSIFYTVLMLSVMFYGYKKFTEARERPPQDDADNLDKQFQ